MALLLKPGDVVGIMNIAIALRESWSAAVDAYQAGFINSERTLQSLMYAKLRERLSNHVILCEPQITVERHGCFVPDIVVLREDVVVAIAELKFVPHGYPVYEFDLRKLAVLAEYRQPFQLLLDPYSGKFTSQDFQISADCILVFAAIGRHDAAAVDPVGLRDAMGQFDERFAPLIFGVGG
jgi:hypothetical protein